MAADWDRVRRTVDSMNARLNAAQTEEDFQGVGHVGREALILLALAVYDPGRHPPSDGVTPSTNDTKRMLTDYLAVKLAGGTNEAARSFAKSAVTLAASVLHDRFAIRLDGELAVVAVGSVVRLIEVLEGVAAPRLEPLRSVEAPSSLDDYHRRIDRIASEGQQALDRIASESQKALDDIAKGPSRKEQVRKWRGMVLMIHKQTQLEKYMGRPVTELLEQQEDFLSLRPHLGELSKSVIWGRTMLAPAEQSTMAGELECILRDVERLEKEWNLT